MIVFFDPDSKLKTPEDVDSLISAEFSDKDTEPELFELVKKYMVHTPCTGNPDSLCIKDPNAGCSKSFPKSFRDQTTINEDSYSVLRRRDTGTQYEHGHHMAGLSGNTAVVPMAMALPLSRPSNTSTNMFTRAMIVQLWSLGTVKMR